MTNIPYKFSKYLSYFFVHFFLLITSCYSPTVKIKEGVIVTSSSQYDYGLTDYLLDDIDSTGWNSGMSNRNWLKYSFERPIYIDSIHYGIDVDYGAITQHHLYYKVKGSSDSTLINSTKFEGSQKDIVLKIDKDDIYELILVFDKDETWINVRYLNIFGKYKNWVKVW